ncbi:MAG: formylglycine-generating enzyme family protein [Paracoccus sp. (in: a-proteobacteria)]|uniref:formylglycine-generating enzyme family protein n=1 Tax=Paracoccus sp. TaxID=267 RepID=UPI0026DEFE67|nr:formylglycine-generating enzyme family protein [Paracoccus sp. (in: a-proteobacteria)]MDO5612917.1 formylglycine-generating enzyme family protein [Paracoccus sp. (in: a-proteobacteria)]
MPLTRRALMISAAANMALARAGAAQQAQSLTNHLGTRFVQIPAGQFLMGDPQGRANEQPQHRVTITRPFWMARTEVTQAEWQALMGENPYVRDRSNPYYNLPGMAERITRPDHPATVSWLDAQEFIAALNAVEPGHRLPTEAEWEYAARAGTTTRYSFGDDPGQLGRYAWYGEEFSDGGHHPVGQKPANPWGLHDIHGNVWEWVQDWYGPYAAGPATDPTGPANGARRVVRGGSWHSTGNGWHSAARRDYAPDYRGISIGFRLVRDV